MEAPKVFRLRWPYYVVAALVYLVLLVVWAPAGLLGWALPRFTQQAVTLGEPEGTLWQGSAARLQVQAAGRAQQLGRLDWQLRPLDLFTGRLGFRLQLGGAGIDARATLRVGVSATELREVRAELPAQLLGEFSPDLALWQAGGRLALEAERLRFGARGGEGRATLRWRDAVSGRVKQPLGSYRADLDGTDQGLAIKLSTERGALVLQGAGSWDPKRGLSFNGAARPAPASRDQLDGLLSLIGPAQADGSRAIRIGR